MAECLKKEFRVTMNILRCVISEDMYEVRSIPCAPHEKLLLYGQSVLTFSLASQGIRALSIDKDNAPKVAFSLFLSQLFFYLSITTYHSFSLSISIYLPITLSLSPPFHSSLFLYLYLSITLSLLSLSLFLSASHLHLSLSLLLFTISTFLFLVIFLDLLYLSSFSLSSTSLVFYLFLSPLSLPFSVSSVSLCYSLCMFSHLFYPTLFLCQLFHSSLFSFVTTETVSVNPKWDPPTLEQVGTKVDSVFQPLTEGLELNIPADRDPAFR